MMFEKILEWFFIIILISAGVLFFMGIAGIINIVIGNDYVAISVTETTTQEQFERNYIIIDPVTGCNYIYARGITPRLNVEGSIMCNNSN